MIQQLITAAAQGDAAPVVDLNGEEAGTSTAAFYQESDPEVAIAPTADVFDSDSADFFGGSLTVTIASGASLGDRLRVMPGAFTEEEGTLYYAGMTVGSVSGGSEGEALVILFDRDNVSDESQQQTSRRVDREIAQELVRAISFYSASEDPEDGTRTVSYTLADGDGGTSAPATATVEVVSVDDPAVAEDDQFTASETLPLEASLFADNGFGPDGDPDGTAIEVTEVNGDETAVGRPIMLESGATVTVYSDGRFVYDPRGAFDLAASASGAVNSSAPDGFSYTITGGDTANVAITVEGDYAPNETYRGDEFDNVIVGTPDRDIFRLEQGGGDRVSGLAGLDSFYFGAAYDSRDLVEGGAGFDVLILQGDYSAGATFGNFTTGNIPEIESISLYSGTNTSFGDESGAQYSYTLTMSDRNVAAGATLKINGSGLRAGENLTLNGAAELNGSFLIFGGQGVDTLTGGAGNDIFVFAHDERFGSGDRVDGGGGYDVVYLRGDYRIDFRGLSPARNAAPLGQEERGLGALAVSSAPDALTNVESIGLLSAADRSYAGGGDGEFDYEIILSDAIADNAGRLTVNGSGLGAAETMIVDGSAETGASLRLFAGAGDDTLTGGGGGDLLYGGLGADTLTGNGGADVFRYQAAAESRPDAPDTIVGFLSGTDKVDLGRIDTDPDAAGDQAFRFIGEEAFSGTGTGAELRLTFNQDMGRWEAQGDTNGDGIADLLILFTETEVVTGSDFML